VDLNVNMHTVLIETKSGKWVDWINKIDANRLFQWVKSQTLT